MTRSPETTQPAPAEVLDEFERVSARFLEEFDPDISLETPLIDAYFDERNLYRHPTISIPHTQEGLRAAHSVATETKYPVPFVVSHFVQDESTTDKVATFKAFSLPAYRLNFIQDITESLSEEHGPLCAQRIMSATRAHELAHSVFHAAPTILCTKREKKISKLYEEFPMSGAVQTLFDSQGEVDAYEPVWIEEAFAAWVAGTVCKYSRPKLGGLSVVSPRYGEHEFMLPDKYLNLTDSGDVVYDLGGSVAGETLSILSSRIKGTIDAILGIALGEKDPVAFRSDLQKRVGSELFRLMFTSQPETTWSSIYSQVVSL